MKSKMRSTVLALVSMLAMLVETSADPVVKLGQTAIGGNPTGVGFVDVAVSPSFGGSVGYLNVVADLDRNGSTSGDWQVRNLAIPLHAGEFGEFAATFSSTFSLAGLVASGDYNVFAEFTSAELSVPDPAGMQLTAGVHFETYDIGLLQTPPVGMDGGALVAPPGLGQPALAAAAPDIVGRVRHDIPGILQGRNECAPTSAAQSLLWLKSRQGLKGLPEQAALLDELKNDMGWTENGIDPANFVPGKEAFVERNGLPITTKRGGGFDGTGTFNFIKAEIEAGEDVEMRIQYPGDGGHWVTIAGWYDNGSKRELFFKDPLSGGDTIDSYVLEGTTIKDYKYGNGTVSFAVGESIVPEPSTYGLVALVAIGAAIGGKRFRRR